MEQIFKLVVSSCDHCTWQGTLLAGDAAVPFHSELELLQALARILPPEGLTETAAQTAAERCVREAARI